MFVASVCVLFALQGSTEVMAQSAAPDAAAPSQSTQAPLQEVVVTARKREESVQKVPLAATVLSPDALTERSIVAAQEIQYSTPGLKIRPNPSPTNGITVAIRGQVQTDTTITLDPSVALYFGDTYIARDAGSGVDLFDIASVQVLKGPQGTLFGRNTTGGAIVLTPTAPTREFEGYVEGGIGDYNASLINGAINVPLSDSLQARLAFQSIRHDGYDVSLTTGQEQDSEKTQAARLGFLWTPMEHMSFRLTIDTRRMDNVPVGTRLLTVDPQGAGNIVTGGRLLTDFQRQPADPLENLDYNKMRSQTISSGGELVSTFGLTDDVSLKSVTSYRTLGLHVNGLDFGASFDLATAPYNVRGYHELTQELTLTGSALESRFNYVGGLYLLHESGTENDGFNLFSDTPAAFSLEYDGTIANSSYAAYAFGDYAITSKLRASVGVRESIDYKQLTQANRFGRVGSNGPCSMTDSTGAFLDPCRRRINARFSGVSYTAALDYQFSDSASVYVTTRRGYRSGGINYRGSAPAEEIPYQPEIVKDVEGGLKADWNLAGMPIRTNLAVFYSWYDQIQRTLTIQAQNGSTITAVVNAAGARIPGAELEITARLLPDLELDLGASAAAARYTDFNYGGVDRSENRFLTPDYTANANLRLHLPRALLKCDDIILSTGAYYQTHESLTIFNHPDSNQGGYALMNARLDFKGIAGSTVDVGFYVKNLADKRYLVNATDLQPIGWDVGYYGAPRTYGATVMAKF
jgi:iron complex outermembrane receptor protein